MKSKKKKQKSGSLNSVKRCLGCPTKSNKPKEPKKVNINYPIRKTIMNAPGRAKEFQIETEQFLKQSKNPEIKKAVAESRRNRGVYDVYYNKTWGYYSGYPAEVNRNENGYKWKSPNYRYKKKN